MDTKVLLLTICIKALAPQPISYTKDTLPRCPQGFEETQELCYQILQQPHPPKCPFDDVAPFTQYRDVIKADGPVWVPVARDLSNGLGFLQWTEPSTNYKDDFDKYFNYTIEPSRSLKDVNCVLYHDGNYTATACNGTFFAVCAYSKFNQLGDQLCADSNHLCSQGDLTAQSNCVCLGTGQENQTLYKKAEFLKPYQNWVYETLTADNCTIGLEKAPDNTYVWSRSKQQVDYTFWMEGASLDYVYGAATKDGWVLTDVPIENCFLFEKVRDELEPKLELSYDNDTNSFTLTVSDFGGLKKTESNTGILLYCFTDASNKSLKYRYPVLTEKQDTQDDVKEFKFLPHVNGPGHYWCESLRYLDLEVVASNTVFLRQKNLFPYEFIGILKFKYVAGTNPLSLSLINHLERLFFLNFLQTDHLKDFYNARIMKILDIDEEANQILLNIHFTSKIQNSEAAEKEEFKHVKQILESMELRKMDIVIVDFRSPDFCPEEKTGRLEWPKTSNGFIAYPDQCCIKPEGGLLTRLCDGNFIDGARWSVMEDCEIFNKSSVTEELLYLITSQGFRAGKIKQLESISERFVDFEILDIYLVGKIFANLVDDNEREPESFAQIISNLMEVKRSVLLNSQIRLNATDALLGNIDKIFFSNTNFGLDGIATKNFFIVPRPSQIPFAGITIQKTSNNYTIEILKDDCNIEAIRNLTELESVICLSKELQNLDNEVIVTVFFQDSFFGQKSTVTTSPVFGFHLLDFPDDFPGPLFILHRVEEPTKSDCSFWNYNQSSKGFWMKDNKSEDYYPFSLCTFWRGSHVALTTISFLSDNITDSLLGVLDSDCSPAEKIAELRNISEKYREFTDYDVYLVGQILKDVSTDCNIDLEALAEIVSNMHFVNRDILSTSQLKNRATDTILHYVDEILKNHEYTKQVKEAKDNFLLLVTDLKSDFSGLMLLDDNDTFKAEILSGNIIIDDLIKDPNLESAVVLSSHLKEQLDVSAKVVITVFANDALFNEKRQDKETVSKVFGVILPKTHDYKGPVSVLHKIYENFPREDCVHWRYNATATLIGSWFKDQDGLNLPSLVQCDFWHTTHFAMLLLDYDIIDPVYLEWITTINCGLSLFGLFCIIFTAIVFKRWRSNTGNQILLHFVFVMISQIALFYVSGNINKNSDSLTCTVIGIILHYSIISAFSWMLVIAILQFKRFVEVFGGPPKGILFKACLCGWVVPSIPVALVFFFDNKNYVKGNGGLCYPSGLGLYLGIWLPIAIIVVINCFIFTMIMYSVGHRKSECRDVGNSDILFQWRLAFLLFFMLGLTWVFGFLGEVDFGEIFVLLFCLTGTLQGFVMFLFFIVFNANTRYLYKQALKRCYCRDY